MKGPMWNSFQSDLWFRLYLAKLNLTPDQAHNKMLELRKDLRNLNRERFVQGFTKGTLFDRIKNIALPYHSTYKGLKSLERIGVPKKLEKDEAIRSFFNKVVVVSEAILFPNKAEAIGMIIETSKNTPIKAQEFLRSNRKPALTRAEALRRRPTKANRFPNIKQ